jgi:hypothetical protein
MKNHQIFTVLAAAAMMILAGCSKDNVTDPVQSQPDAQAMKYMIENADSVAAFSVSDEYSIDDEGTQAPAYDILANAGVQPQIISSVVSDSSRPLRWGRHIFWDQIVRDYHVVMSGDTLATVTVTKTIPGEFRVAWGVRTADSVVFDTLVKKPFTEETKRNILFRRIGRHPEVIRNWIPVAITMVEGKSLGASAFTIASLEVSDSHLGFDTTVTDPLATWFRFGIFRHGCIPIIPVRDSVTVRVTITSTDDSAEVVYLRHGIGWQGHIRRRVPMELVSTTGGPGNFTRVYARKFTTELGNAIIMERFNAVIDAFSHGSIYDKAAPFDNEFWGVPYIVSRF